MLGTADLNSILFCHVYDPSKSPDTHIDGSFDTVVSFTLSAFQSGLFSLSLCPSLLISLLWVISIFKQQHQGQKLIYILNVYR